MSDVDDFALQLLQRAQVRQKVISENLNKENSSDEKSTIDNMIKKISENSPKKKDIENSDNSCRILNLSSSPRRSPLKNQNLIVNEEPQRSYKESVTDLKPPVELFVMKPIESEVEEELSDSDVELSVEEEINTEEVEQIPACFKTPVMSESTRGAIKSETKRTLKRLGQLYGDVTIASPVHKHSELEKTPEFTPNQINQSRASPVARRSRLNALAHSINNWEDDLSHHCSPTSRFNMSVTPKVGRSGSPPKTFSSQANAETNNMVRKNAYTTSRNSVTVTPNTKVSNNICTPKVITEVYSDACESKGDGVNCTPQSAQLVEPLCVSSKKDRGLIIQRKMYLENNEAADNSQNSSRAHAWDDSLFNALEAQGFVPTPAKDKMVYHFSNPPAGSSASPTRSSPNKQQANSPRNSSISKSPIKSTVNLNASKISPSKLVSTAAAASPEKMVDDTPRVVNSIRKKFEFGGRSPNKSTSEKAIFTARAVETPRAKASVAQRAILYESNLNKSVVEKDPTELSVAERAKLFERQAFSRPAKTGSGVEPPKPVRTFNALTAGLVYTPLKPKAEVAQPSITKDIKPLSPQRSPAKKQEEEMCPSPPPPPQLPPSVAITSPSRNKRYSKSPTPKRSMSPPKSQYPGCRDVKRIKINEPKDGHMYPSLTDIEATETETETDVVTETETEDEPMYEDEDMDSETSQMSASSLGTHIQQVAKLSSPAKSPLRSPPRRNRHYRPTEDFSASLACRQIDAYIDEALEGQDFTLDTMMETELEAHASSTPIANASLDKSESDDTALVTMIPDETRNPKQLDFEDDGQDAENEEANSSFGSFATSRPDIAEDHVLTETDETYKADVPNDSVVSFSCLDDSDSDCDETNPEFKKPVLVQEPDPLSTSSPHGYGQNHKESSPAQVNTPLLHTVSFYRRQQTKNYATLTPTSHFKAAEKANDKNTMEKKEDVSEQIKKLEEEVSAHVKSIAQVSKALNLCKATVEFSESTENVECEKVLLIATQKRTALVNEIHRLKTEGVLAKKTLFSPGKHDLGPSCRGNMTLSNIEIQLKRDFLSRAMKGDAVYHFVLLTKYRHQVEASSLVSVGNGVSSSNIQGGLLHFPNEFTIGNLEPEFSVKVEIYLLQTQKEYLPHEAKYHIKKEPKTGILTPRKLKMDAHTAKYLGRPFQQSPAGPDSIKTTNFSLCGNLTIDISTLQRSHWSLEKNMTVCPLEGSVSIKIQCSAEGGIEEKGFLTLFDDVSGFGAWHRRWCKLTPSQLAYWRYPEDETKKEPLGTISLRKCVTNRVGPVARDVCARANTFLLVTTRSPYVDDKDTLVTSCHTEYTAVRHLLSADTKEERDLWCKQFNRALANLRAWDPQAHSPDDTLF